MMGYRLIIICGGLVAVFCELCWLALRFWLLRVLFGYLILLVLFCCYYCDIIILGVCMFYGILLNFCIINICFGGWVGACVYCHLYYFLVY